MTYIIYLAPAEKVKSFFVFVYRTLETYELKELGEPGFHQQVPVLYASFALRSPNERKYGNH